MGAPSPIAEPSYATCQPPPMTLLSDSQSCMERRILWRHGGVRSCQLGLLRGEPSRRFLSQPCMIFPVARGAAGWCQDERPGSLEPEEDQRHLWPLANGRSTIEQYST
ncbi:hypothetical protein BRADI_4g22169v3 [Brachypodium distachyon]|uniref:Uncharacterized protein n=1 Tax=Brachypodium distachyon TaxID=15368 RepID=A0A2K2CPE0_BRADI|nr:hypothetical protein BRADI_4g22169v3 [Brachypodium distachyon]